MQCTLRDAIGMNVDSLMDYPIYGRGHVESTLKYYIEYSSGMITYPSRLSLLRAIHWRRIFCYMVCLSVDLEAQSNGCLLQTTGLVPARSKFGPTSLSLVSMLLSIKSAQDRFIDLTFGYGVIAGLWGTRTLRTLLGLTQPSS